MSATLPPERGFNPATASTVRVRYPYEVLAFGLSFKTTADEVTKALSSCVPDVRYISESPYGLVYAVRYPEDAEKLIADSPFQVEENFIGVCRQIRQSPPSVIPKVYSTRQSYSSAWQAALGALFLTVAVCVFVSWFTGQARLLESAYALPLAGTLVLVLCYVAMRLSVLWGRGSKKA